LIVGHIPSPHKWAQGHLHAETLYEILDKQNDSLKVYRICFINLNSRKKRN
jgi:hypothetical protein